MRPLVLCQSCKRHVKASEAQCPFCSAAVVSLLGRAATRADASLPRGRPGGRAALFLAGAALAAGCADEPEPDAHDDGATAGSDAGTQNTPKDSGIVSVADAGRDAGRDAGSMIAVPYGIAIDPRPDASIVTPKDAGPSCPQLGNLPVPVYGIGIDIPPRDACRDAGEDAGTDAGADAGKDGGTDAGKDAGGDAGKDAGLIAVPYGIAVPTYGVAIDPNR